MLVFKETRPTKEIMRVYIQAFQQFLVAAVVNHNSLKTESSQVHKCMYHVHLP